MKDGKLKESTVFVKQFKIAKYGINQTVTDVNVSDTYFKCRDCLKTNEGFLWDFTGNREKETKQELQEAESQYEPWE